MWMRKIHTDFRMEPKLRLKSKTKALILQIIMIQRFFRDRYRKANGMNNWTDDTFHTWSLMFPFACYFPFILFIS